MSDGPQDDADPPRPSLAYVSGKDAVDLLTDRKALRFLLPFLDGPQTLSSAAAALGRSRSTVAYWVPRFLDAGLVERLSDAERQGPPMPRYRAVGERIAVPVKAVPVDRRAAMLDSGRERILRLFLDGLDEAIAEERGAALAFASAGEGRASITFVETAEPVDRPYTDGWYLVRLDRADAVAFAGELEALLDRYAAKGGRSTYVVHAGVVREPKVRWRSAADQRIV